MKKIILLIVLVMILCFSGCSSENDGNTEKSSETPSSEKETAKEPGFGDTITFDGLEITFSSEYNFTSLDNEYSELDGSDVIRIPVHVKNVSDDVAGINMFYIKTYGSKGIALDDISFYFTEDNDMLYDAGTDSLRSGAEIDVICHVLFDGDGDYYISFDNISSKIEIKLAINK